MSDNTAIEWADATWNPVTGCTKVSPGCDHCYAETFAERFRGTPGHYYEHGFDVQLRPDKLDLPLTWRKPKRVFVNSMSDLFHDQVPDTYIAQVFAVMLLAPHHTFQVLTKRHARMRSLLTTPTRFNEQGGYMPGFEAMVRNAAHNMRNNAARADWPIADDAAWPLPNVWLGVSAEDQKWADIRIPVLLDTPAAVRFISAEPLLGPIDLRLIDYYNPDHSNCSGILSPAHEPACGREPGEHWGLNWVIVGGESGRGARPMHPARARSLRDQCVAAGVPFHFKQWGEWRMTVDLSPELAEHGAEDLVHGDYFTRVGKKRAGRELDGRTWDQYPQAGMS